MSLLFAIVFLLFPIMVMVAVFTPLIIITFGLMALFAILKYVPEPLNYIVVLGMIVYGIYKFFIKA
ncbi:hypothetical protein B6S12_04680 [Helicobacter valdiviensis]|uniref:Uncharacterized protein n=1 Tax=Helicobacter valdiviensis TaxID=1458358 RepID=A0A2W6NLB7_9HELI|nr:hypothetical protein [Helicobacter valdiviensis]PZT48226.1 hypothetical protein B6S12_04680 [Helicobacter valdiviensis]